MGTAQAAVRAGVRADAAPPAGSEAELDARIKVMDAAADDRRARAILANTMHAGGPAMKSGAGTLLAGSDLGPWPGWSLYFGSSSADNVINSKGDRSSGPTLGEGIGAVKQSAQATMANGQLHVGLLTTDGKLYDKVRFPNGDWSVPIAISSDAHTTAFTQAALPGGELHFTLLADDGTVRDYVYNPGDYPGYSMGGSGADRTVRFDSLPGKVKGLASAGLPNGELHLELLTADGKVWTNVLKSGKWSGSTAADSGATPSTALSVAATANGDVRLQLLGSDKKVREKTRKTDGSWTALSTVDATGNAKGLAAVAVPNALPHVAVLTTTGTVSDFALQANNTWVKSAVAGAPVATGVSAGASGTGEVQLELTAADGRVWNTARTGTGAWSAPFVVDGARGRLKDIQLAGAPNGDLHTVTLAEDGTVWDQIRRANTNSWETSWVGVMTGTVLVDGSKQARAVTVAVTPNGEVHLLTLGNDSVVRDIVRAGNGSWAAPVTVDATGTARGLAAAAAPNGEVNLAVLRADGTVQHAVRAAAGSWRTAAVATPPAKGVAIAAVPNGEVHLGVLGNDAKAWATSRRTDGSWTAPVVAYADHPVRQVSAVGSPAGEVHLVSLDTDGTSWDTIRRTDGSWFRDPAQIGLVDRTVTSVSTAAVPAGDLHVNQFVGTRVVGAGVQDESRAGADDDARTSRDLGLQKYLEPYATASNTKLPQYDTDVTDFMSASGVRARNQMALQSLPPPVRASPAAQAKVDEITRELVAEAGAQDPWGLLTMLGASTKEGSADDVRRFIQYHGLPQTAPVKGTPEFRIEVESLKARWASGDVSNPTDWKKVLVEAEEVASAEWLAELAGQAQPRADILKAELDALTALQSGSEAMHQALGYGWSAGQILKWQANPTQRQNQANPRTDAQATADLALVKGLVTAQAAVARKAANDAKAAADKVGPALAAGDRTADENGLPRGRGLLYAVQSAQVTRAAAAAALATANALDTAVAATSASVADSAAVLANAQAQAAAARAQFQRQSAEESATRAADLAAGAKAKADAAAAAATNVATAKAQVVQAEADAAAALERGKAAAAKAATERQNAAKAKADAETRRGSAKKALDEALDKNKAADERHQQSQSANTDAVRKATAAKEAEARAATFRNTAAVAQRQQDVAAANAQALAAAAVAAQGTAAAEEARAAAQQAAAAATQAATEAGQAATKAGTATEASVAAREEAAKSGAAAARATAWAADAQTNALIAYSTAMAAEAAAATAIDNSEAAAKKAAEASASAAQASQESLRAASAAVAAKQAVDQAVDATGVAAGQAYAAGQAADQARAAAALVTAPVEQAITLGAPFARNDSSAGLAVLASQGARTMAEQQSAVAGAVAAQAAAQSAAAKAAAERATGDGKAAAEAAAKAAASAAAADASAAAAQKSAAKAAADSAATKASAARTAALDAQARAQAQAAAKSAQDALADSQAAGAAATEAEKDAVTAAQAAKDADTTAKNARGTADRAAEAATAAEKSAASAKADSAKAEESAKAAEEQLRRDEAALAAQLAAAQAAAQARHDLDARQAVMDTQARLRTGRANLAYLFQVGGVASKTLATARLAGPGQVNPPLFFDQGLYDAWEADVAAANGRMNGIWSREEERNNTVWKYFTSDFGNREPEYDTAVLKELSAGGVYKQVSQAAGYGWAVNPPQASQESMDRVAQILKEKQAQGDPYNLWTIMLFAPKTRGSADDVRRFIQFQGFPTVAPAAGSAEFRREVESLKTRWSSGDPGNPVDPYRVLVEVEETASAEWEAEYAAQAGQRTAIANAEIQALTALQSSAVAMHDALGNAWVAKNLMETQARPKTGWFTPAQITADLNQVKQRVDALALTADQNAVNAKAAVGKADAAVAAAQQTAAAQGTPVARGLSYANQSAQVTKSASAAAQATALALRTAVAAANATVADSGALLANASAQAHAARAAFLRQTAQDSAQQAEADAVAAEAKAKAAADAAAVVAQDKARIAPLEAGSQKAAADAKAAAATADKERQNAAASRQVAEQERAKAATATADALKQADAAATEETRAAGDARTADEGEAKAKQAEKDAGAARERSETARKEMDAARARSAAADAEEAAKRGTSGADAAAAAAKDARQAANRAMDAAVKADEDADAASAAAVAARAAATVSWAAAAKSESAARTARSAAAKTQANSAQGHYLAAEAIMQAGIAKENSDAATALAKSAAKNAADAKSAADAAKQEAAGAVADASTASGQAYAASQQAEIARDTANAVTAPADQAIELGIAFAATSATAGLSVVVAGTAKTLAEQSAQVAEMRAAEAEAFAKAAQGAADRALGEAKLAAQAAADAAKSAAKGSRAAAEALKSANRAAADAKDVQAVSQRLDDLNAQAQADSWKAEESARQARVEATAASSAADASEKDATKARTAADQAKQSAANAGHFATAAEASATSARKASDNANADAVKARQIAEASAQLDRNPPPPTMPAYDDELPGLLIEPVDIQGTGYATDQCKINPGNLRYCKLPARVHLTGRAMAFMVTCDIANATAAACMATGKYQKEFIESYPVDFETDHVFDLDMVAIDWQFTKALAYGLISDFIGCARNLSFKNADCYWAAASLLLPPALKVAARAAATLRYAILIGDMVGMEVAFNLVVQSARTAAIDAATFAKLRSAFSVARFRFSCKPKPMHSFVAGTHVLMADGGSRPIEEIRVGDLVENAAPGGGPEQHRVERTYVTTTDTAFTDLTVSGPDGPKTVTGTQNHPYYDLTRGAFVDAAELAVGDRLQTDDYTVATVQAVRNYTAAMVTYDLTVQAQHTYYVLAGRTPVLVHNSGEGDALTALEQQISDEAKAIFSSPEFASIRAGHAAGEVAEISVRGVTVMYEPGLPSSGFTMFGERGFVMGPEAFVSESEAAKTVLHEMHRITTSEVAGGVTGELAADETKAAFNFANKAFLGWGCG
ncbi:polymorphic toxin-type HINT domain-containing protein [Kitasatospora sp. NPDC002040]|uniref:polymorphic toxin-type HINT domain-containing protein n=1 Tax=Kitasatospora sp. NPDC002040 TaxID=3154661 RepID=UPI00332D8D15